MRRVRTDRLTWSESDGRMWLDDHPFTGTAYDIDSEGSPFVEENYRDGRLHGRCRHFDSGRLAAEHHWRDGLRHGPWKEWSREGDLTLDLRFVDDEPETAEPNPA